MKKDYSAPELNVHGDIREIVRGGSAGWRLDADFIAGTPFGKVTFS